MKIWKRVIPVMVLAMAVVLVAGCGDASEKGDPKQLVKTGWEQFRLDDFEHADKSFESAAHWLEEKAKGGVLAAEDKHVLATAYYGRGIVASLRRPAEDKIKAEKSKEFFDKAIVAEPKGDVAAWALMAMVRDEHLPVRSDVTPDSGKLQADYAAVEKAQPGTPAAVEAFTFRMSLLIKSLTAEDAKKAVAEIDAYLSEYKGAAYRTALYALEARACETLGDYKKSLEMRIKSAETKELDAKNPNMDWALDWYQIALCAEYDVGDIATARKYFNKFLEKYPVDQKAFICERELKRLDIIEASGGDVKAAGELGILPPGTGGAGLPMRKTATTQATESTTQAAQPPKAPSTADSWVEDLVFAVGVVVYGVILLYVMLKAWIWLDVVRLRRDNGLVGLPKRPLGQVKAGNEASAKLGLWGRFQKALPLLVIIGAFLWASSSIALRQEELAPADAIVLRMGHWQLEPGMPGTLAQMIKDFESDPVTQARIKDRYGRNRPVRIKQIKVGDPTYSQWITCQMIGETAPDICEIGLANLGDMLWLQFETRYFLPLTDLAMAPNPYNKVRQSDLDDIEKRVYKNGKEPTYDNGTVMPEYLWIKTEEQRKAEITRLEEFSGLPLCQTYLDGMRAGYREQLQAFTKVPLSRFTSRMFYNKTLYKQLTGKDHPEDNYNYRIFLDDCKKIAEQKLPDGMNFSPIACSGGFHIWMWNSGMFDPMTFSTIARADFDRNGIVGGDETYAALRAGRITFDSPGMRAKFQMTGQVSQYFQKGFTAVARDEAVMKFAKQQAVFISTGTWDFASLEETTNGEFEVGIMPFPKPAQDDPEYGRLMVGPYLDKADQGFMFGVSRRSEHPREAEDFLLFLASRRINQKLNHAINWLPAIRDVPLPPRLAQFTSNPRGMTTGQDILNIGGDAITAYNQAFGEFQLDFKTDKFIDTAQPKYIEKGLADWENQQRDWRQAVLNSERLLAAIRGEALLNGAKEDDPLWVRYRAFTANRQVMPEVIRETQAKTVRDKPLRPVGPYEFLPEAIANIKKNAAGHPATEVRP